MSYNLDNGFFTVFEQTPLVEEGLIETSLVIGDVYHSPRAGMDSELLNVPIKITTPEDYYILKALLELQENKDIFALSLQKSMTNDIKVYYLATVIKTDIQINGTE